MRIVSCLPILIACSAAAIAAADERPGESPPSMVPSSGPITQSVQQDANQLFDLIVRRYRELETYRDSARLVQVIERFGEEPVRTETQMVCEVKDEQLTVTTPKRDLARRLGMPVDFSPNDDLDRALLDFDFWLAPHMAIKFSNAPLNEMRPGVCDTFLPTEADHVTIDDREMVHLELKTGDRYSEDYEAKFDLYLNPDSMLIERIEGNQRLPDGAHCLTTLEITPEPLETTSTVETEDAAAVEPLHD